MMDVKQIKDWLNTLSDDDEVGVDEGGLCLRIYDADDELGEGEEYLELGGLPLREEETCESASS